MRFLVLISSPQNSERRNGVSLLELDLPNGQHREDPLLPLPRDSHSTFVRWETGVIV